MSDNWQITYEEFFADADFKESAENFTNYDGFDFEYQVQQVADRIFAIHLERGVVGEFIFGFEANSEGELSGASVALSLPGEWSLYLMQSLELKRLTNDREAANIQQALEIKDCLLESYAEIRRIATEKGLL